MKIEKDKYITVISYGDGRHFLRGPFVNSLTAACAYAKIEASSLRKAKAARAPRVSVSVLRVVEIYDEQNS